MGKIASQIKNLRANFSTEELLLLGMVVSAFLTVYMAVASMIAIILYLLFSQKLLPVLRSVPRAWSLGVFCGLILIVAALCLNWFGVFVAVALALFLAIAIFVRSVMTERLFETAIQVGCGASLISVVVIVAQYLLDPKAGEQGTPSTFLNANFYGAAVELIVLFCLYLLFKPGQTNKLFYGIVMALNLGGLVISNSYSAILALALAVMFYLMISRKFMIFIALVAIGVAGVLILLQLKDPQGLITEVQKDIADRLNIWHTAIQGFLDSPIFGRGGGSYSLAQLKFGGPIKPHAHNLFIDSLMSYGVAGMALITVYVANLTRSLFGLKQTRDQRGIRDLVLATSFCVIVHGLTDVTLISPEPAILFALTIGVAGIYDKTRARPASL